MTHELTFTLNCGLLSDAELDSIPALLAANPFAQPGLLLDDNAGTEQAYSDAALLKVLRAGGEWNMTLTKSAPGEQLNVDLLQRQRGAMVSVTVVSERLQAEYEQFLSYARQWLEALANVTSGHVSDSAGELAALHRSHGLERPPACFTTNLRWVHFLAASYYTLFLSTEDLLATPAYSVEQTAGVVIVRNYADPFAGGDAAPLKQLAAITDYLRAKNYFPNKPR
jgi:hypothetical protein